MPYFFNKKLFLIAIVIWVGFGFSIKANAATGDITAVRIVSGAEASPCSAGTNCNGWVAEIDITGLNTGGTYNLGLGANNNPSTAKIVFTVTSPGYDTSGNATTIARTIYGTKQLRKPYPNQATMDEVESGGTLTVRVALSDFVYSGDSSITVNIGSGFYTNGTANNAVTGLAVTNNSTLGYPKTIGRWAWPGYERVTGDFLLESTVFNHFARNGKPVAAVKYTCSDQHSNTVTQTVNNMTVSTRTGDANKVLVYAATMPVSTLTQGDIITCNFTAYPWVGDSTALVNSDLVANGGDGIAQPSEALGPIYEVLDKSGTYPKGFAVVDATNGQASAAATWVYSSQSAAESAYAGGNTNSYRTIGYALQALKAYNNADATFSHNDPGGGTVLLPEGSYTWSSTGRYADSGTQNMWVTVTKLSTASRANTILAAGGASNWNTQKIKFTDLNLAGSASGVLSSRTASDVLWLHNNTINYTADGAVYSWLLAYATQNAVTKIGQGFDVYGGVKGAYALIRGNTATALIPSSVYAILGNTKIKPSRFCNDATCYGGMQTSENSIIAFNTVYGLSSSMLTGQPANTQTLTWGIAIVQNVFEKITTTDNIMGIAADSSTSNPANNVILWYNDFVGERLNMAYNDFTGPGTPLIRTNWSFKYNLLDRYSNVSDVDSHNGNLPDGTRIGNWPVRYGAGTAGNIIGSSPFYGEFLGLYTLNTTLPGTLGGYDFHYTNNASYTGTAAGNGDYHPTDLSPSLNLVSSGSALLPYDIEGTARKNDGTGAAGAYEYVAAGDTTSPTVSDGTITTSSVTSTSLTLSWTKATDDTSAQNALVYRVYRSSSNNIDSVANIYANGTAVNASTTDIATLDVSSLDPATTYYFNIVVADEAGNSAVYTTKSQVTLQSDLSAPTVNTYSPTDGASDVAISSNLVLTFNENVAKSTGNIYIKLTSNDSTAQTIDVTDATVSVSNDTVTINPPSNLDYSTGYYVTIDNGALVDTATPTPNAYVGISNSTTWNFTTASAPSSVKAITSFALNGLTPAVTGTINEGAKTVTLTVPYGTSLTNLVPTIVYTGSSIDPASGAAHTFTDGVAETYTVTAEDATTQAYQVTVNVTPASSATTITSFDFASPAVTGTVDNTAHTVALTVPYGTDVTYLTPTIVLATGATISPDTGVATDFTSPVTYTVTAQDGTTEQIYTVTVTSEAAPVTPSNGPVSSGGGGGGRRNIITTSIPTETTNYRFLNNLSYGSEGNDVTELQKFLVSQGFLTSDNITGAFRGETQKALQAFQKANGIVTSGTPQTTGFGNFGPTTRAKVNAILAGSIPSTSSGQAVADLQATLLSLQKQLVTLLTQLIQKLQAN